MRPRTLFLLVFLPISTHADLAERMLECRAIVDAKARVRCYDDAIDALSPASFVPVADHPILKPNQMPEDSEGTTPEERFGLSGAESRRKAGLEFEDKDLDLIQATITAVSRTAYDKFVVVLDNGQKWRQTDTKRLRLQPGDAVRISSAIFGSFLLEKSTGSRMVRVQRIE